MLCWSIFSISTFLPLFYDWRHNKLDIYHPKNAFLSYLYLQIGMSWLILRYGQDIVTSEELSFGWTLGRLQQSDYDMAFMCATAGVIAFHVGYYAACSVVRRIRPPFAIRASSRRVDIA